MGGLFAKPRDYIDAETTCAEMLGVEGNLKAGGFAGYNFVIDNQRLRTRLTIESNSLLQQNLIGYLIANLKRNPRSEK